MFVAKLDDVLHRSFWHERERAAGKFQRINVGAHRFEQIFKVTPAYDGVIRPTDFR